MPTFETKLRAFFTGPDLPADARRTFRFHVAYAILDAVVGGVLLNAPIVALRAMQADSWQLPIREVFSGVGMLAALYLGSWMAPRRKMPFVFIPGLLAGASSLAMAFAVGDSFWFLMLFSLGAMFEIITRPAITAIVRLNYPVAARGHVTGCVRQWSSLAFLASNLTAAYLLQRAGGSALHMARMQIVFVALLGTAAFFCFRQIRVNDNVEKLRRDLRPEFLKNVTEAALVVARDGRFRRYLFGCFLDNFSQMLYFPLIWAFLSKTLEYDYVGCAAMMHAIPALAAFVATGMIGRWIDRTNPWVSWAWIRFAWGFDALLLAATPFAAGYLPPMLFVLPLLGRLLRGSVQGGWWILWWQIGVTNFAPPGKDTSRYTGLMVFLNGFTKVAASLLAMVLAGLAMSPVAFLVVGGAGVILSGVYSLTQAARERRENRPRTIAEFESQF